MADIAARERLTMTERQGRRGQVATEWLMTAGILTAVAIFLSTWFKPVLVDIARQLARAIRTPGL